MISLKEEEEEENAAGNASPKIACVSPDALHEVATSLFYYILMETQKFKGLVIMCMLNVI